jgi:transcriptional regulator with XRE-family HTH domain
MINNQEEEMKRKKQCSLRVLRQDAKLTIRELSEKTGVNDAVIQGLEVGKGKGFNVAVKHTLADFFHVPVELLFPEIQEQVDLLLGKSRRVQMFVSRGEAKKG